MNKKFTLLLLIVIIASISCVSATNTTDTSELNTIDMESNLEITEEISTLSVSGNTFADIQNAVESANDGDTISLNGTYIGSGEEIKIGKSLTLQGSNDATLDGKRLSRIMNVTNSNMIFKDITFANGFNKDDSGGIDLKYSNATFKNCKFINNFGSSGASIDYGYGYIIVEDSSFINNSAEYQVAGIKCNYFNTTAPIVKNTLFENNSGTWYVALAEGTVINCTFINNKASWGAGCIAYSVAINSTFINNTAGSDGGGAIYWGSAINSTFINNSCTGDGGAIYAADANITNCIFTANSCDGYGGAVYLNDGICAVNCTFTENSANKGGAIYGGKSIDNKFSKNSNPYLFNCINNGAVDIQISQGGSYYGSKTLTIKLTDKDNGDVISNEKVLLTFSNGKTINLTTNSNGIASYNIPFAPETYSATATFGNSSKKLANIKIAKAPVTLTPTKLSTTYASGKYFQVKVINSKTKSPMPNVKLTLKVYTGKKYKSVTVSTDSKGIAKYSASTLGIGTHKVVVSVKDTKYVSAGSKTSSVKVSKATYSIVAPKVTNNYKQSGTFKVTVKNKASGKVVSGVKVTLKVYTGKKYKTYTVKTNSKGIASISTKALTKTTHKVSISIKSSSKYKSASKSSSIKIIKGKIKTKFLFDRMYYNYYNNGALKSVTVYLDLIDANGNTLKKPIVGQIKREYLGQVSDYGDVAKGTSGSGIEVFKNIGSWTFFVQIDFNGDSAYESARFIKYL